MTDTNEPRKPTELERVTAENELLRRRVHEQHAQLRTLWNRVQNAEDYANKANHDRMQFGAALAEAKQQIRDLEHKLELRQEPTRLDPDVLGGEG